MPEAKQEEKKKEKGETTTRESGQRSALVLFVLVVCRGKRGATRVMCSTMAKTMQGFLVFFFVSFFFACAFVEGESLRQHPLLNDDEEGGLGGGQAYNQENQLRFRSAAISADFFPAKPNREKALRAPALMVEGYGILKSVSVTLFDFYHPRMQGKHSRGPFEYVPQYS